MVFARFLLPALLAFHALPASADTLTDLLPPDSKVVFGIRVHNLAVSSVARSFAAQAKAAAGGWLNLVPDGIDILRDVDELLIASPAKGARPPAIIVVTGRFDVARLFDGATRYHEVPLLTGEKANGSALALLAGDMAVIGDAALVRAAIDQRGKSRIDAALNDRITSLRQRYDVWGLGELPDGFVAPTPEARELESIDRFQFGMQLASGLGLDAELHVRSPQEAAKLNAALAMMAVLLKGQETSGSAAKFDAQVDGATLKLTVSISEDELKKVIRAETSALLAVSGKPAPAPNGADSPVTGPHAARPTMSQAAPAPAKPVDKERDTVILALPGKK